MGRAARRTALGRDAAARRAVRAASAPALARLAVLMGSGELAPTMAKVHRSVLGRLGPPPVPAVLLGTPFGFQENARELASRAAAYFRESLRTTLEVAGSAGGDEVREPGASRVGDPFAAERLTSAVRDARYVFSGPGSPTYALRSWQGSVVPQLLREKLTHGGAVAFASAAALTLGAFTVPVYEIYKVGEEPHWLEGLDVMAAAGLRVAVVPHYNNAEGGSHDTRFCYLGERRLAAMEEQLPDDCFVLGVDEHTAVVLDLDAETASIGGVGVVTVRRRGRSTTFASGDTVPIGALAEAAFAARAGGRSDGTGGGTGERGRQRGADGPGARFVPGQPLATSPLLDIVRAAEKEFAAALAAGDAEAAVAAILHLEQEIVAWSTDIPQEDEMERARASLRSMVVELGRVAVGGLRELGEVVGPFVETLIELRANARDARRYDEADAVRDRLAQLGVELRDAPERTGWVLSRETPGAGG